MKTLILAIYFLGLLKDVLSKSGITYIFFRNMDTRIDSETRRVFGGGPADLKDFPAAAALLDRYWTIRCSGAVIADFWAITAAHCVTSHIAYIKYNTQHPSATDGDHSPVLYLYRHPNYKVVQEDEGHGMDVTVLNHDLGLLRSRDKMILLSPRKPLADILKYQPKDIVTKEVDVMGFGRTDSEKRSSGEELFTIKLKTVVCDRGTWFHCQCAVVTPSTRSRGVCSGDSGGPVVYRGVQVGITSMGPIECATRKADLTEGSTSVFTSLYQYVDLINATIHDTDGILRVRQNAAAILNHHISMLAIFFLVLTL